MEDWPHCDSVFIFKECLRSVLRHLAVSVGCLGLFCLWGSGGVFLLIWVIFWDARPARRCSRVFSETWRRRLTELRHRPRKWLVGDPVWVKICPRGGADQRNSGSVTRPGQAMCLPCLRQRRLTGEISSLASPVHPLVSSRTWAA